MLYRYRAGIPWRNLPARFGDFRVVHTGFSRWSKTGVWERLFEHLAIGDKGYDACQRVIEPLQAQGKTVVIPPRRNRKNWREYDQEL